MYSAVRCVVRYRRLYTRLYVDSAKKLKLLLQIICVQMDDDVPREATRRRSGGFRLERSCEEGEDAFTMTLKVRPGHALRRFMP